jgi:hypothetical protein
MPNARKGYLSMEPADFRGAALLVALLGAAGWGCTIVSADQGGTDGGDVSDTGGSTGTGGAVATGGSGSPASGGSPGTGGLPGTGGIPGTGGHAGSTGSGGAGGTGGSIATGGRGGSAGTTGAGGSTATGGAAGGVGAGGAGGSTAAVKLPCDIYAADGGPCVAAHSTVRALYAAYNGNLYQVRRADGTTKDIGLLTAGGFADGAAQDAFCGTSTCTISIIYDQSGRSNHLTKGPPGGAKTTGDNEADAKALPVTISGHAVYAEHNPAGVGYRNNKPSGTATGDNPETEYMVTGGTYYNGGCCFDYGNMETTSRDDGEGTMEAIYFGNCTIWGKGSGSGPWVMGDLENGLWAGNVSPYNNNVPVTSKYVTAMLKGDAAGKNHWTIKAGNAQSGALTKMFDGQRPSSRYNPMRKEGAIGLGTGGDNSDGAQGNFFEGVMTAAYSSDAADDAVQASIVAAYGQ